VRERRGFLLFKIDEQQLRGTSPLTGEGVD
jgi:hypothetical protein